MNSRYKQALNFNFEIISEINTLHIFLKKGKEEKS